MFPSLKIARLFRINVFIHWSFWLLPLWVMLNQHEDSILPLWMNLTLIAALFGCIVLHEFGHALTARHFGIRTRSITLSPLGGIAQLERMSHEPKEEVWIAIAGPMVNVVIAAGLGTFLLLGIILDPKLFETAPGTFLGMLLLLNIVMVVFNMIPAFPMDGGRVLRAILAGSMGLLEGARVAVIVGTVFAVLIGVVGVFLFGNPWMVLIAAFVIWSGFQELRALEYEEQQRREAEEELFIVVPSSR
ncbi:MAG TPA: site-2 protease family protein, partial [Gemmataceae bacterium]|nr:site-2 protease family protein [Gemmataceae bacterium]